MVARYIMCGVAGSAESPRRGEGAMPGQRGLLLGSGEGGPVVHGLWDEQGSGGRSWEEGLCETPERGGGGTPPEGQVFIGEWW